MSVRAMMRMLCHAFLEFLLPFFLSDVPFHFWITRQAFQETFPCVFKVSSRRKGSAGHSGQ